MPGEGLRPTLRSRFGIEAAVGAFSPGGGGGGVSCVRLSHAVYTQPEEFAALRDAVLELTDEAASSS